MSDATYSQGDIVYVLHEAPKAPLKDRMTDAEMLQWDQENCWVGKIIKIKANSSAVVYVLVAWLYWTKEVPNDQRKLPNFSADEYAKGELIMSNWLDVIDSTTVSGLADIQRLDEQDVDTLLQAPERFWRQTYDAGTLNQTSKRIDPFSSLRKFCSCNKPFNPDKTMFKCSNSQCGMWNHDHCLETNVRQQTASHYKNDDMDKYAQDHALPKTVMKQAVEDIKSVVKDVGDSIIVIAQGAVADINNAISHESPESSTPKQSSNTTQRDVSATPSHLKRGRPKKLDDLFIRLIDGSNGPYARIRESKGDRSWDVSIDCTVCGQTMVDSAGF